MIRKYFFVVLKIRKRKNGKRNFLSYYKRVLIQLLYYCCDTVIWKSVSLYNLKIAKNEEERLFSYES